jgi:hypothetical protein
MMTNAEEAAREVKANGRPADLRTLILAAGAPKMQPLEAWGMHLYIRELQAGQIAAMQERMKHDELRAMAIWIVSSVSDADGRLIFSESDEAAVMDLGAGEVMRVGLECLKLNGQGERAINALLKNSATPIDASASA